ncbi:SRP40, C-terminal domain-containing protein [Exophiala viscosa]|uniref:SRP40, C-terminal domain-containing protein n=1 Tax=Exophiala viscosa TaxID=2486360 RepID=A0AAN6DUZ7_9EURO|nr:SRP40, C-terminal domain-containing protein [Exophiala viscosa]
MPEEDSPDTEEPSEQITATQTPVIKKKHTGARPTPLAQLSAQASADSHISNAYRSYEYAERAYNDLSVTRGKGFTKEKNKKKRGSYRGGPIDISGGKGFKFDD